MKRRANGNYPRRYNRKVLRTDMPSDRRKPTYFFSAGDGLRGELVEIGELMAANKANRGALAQLAAKFMCTLLSDVFDLDHPLTDRAAYPALLRYLERKPGEFATVMSRTTNAGTHVATHPGEPDPKRRCGTKCDTDECLCSPKEVYWVGQWGYSPQLDAFYAAKVYDEGYGFYDGVPRPAAISVGEDGTFFWPASSRSDWNEMCTCTTCDWCMDWATVEEILVSRIENFMNPKDSPEYIVSILVEALLVSGRFTQCLKDFPYLKAVLFPPED